MMFRGNVFAPPNCPAVKEGTIPDLRTVPFTLRISDCTLDAQKRCTETEIFINFGANVEGDYPNLVESEVIITPIDSPLVQNSRQLAGDSEDDMVWAEADEVEGAARLRDALCERVAQCRGVVDGECWALGTAGLQAAIEQAVQQPTHQ